MEFMRLADVEVVETATDTDKVLIEQNGEIKRVPKTEVGGGAGGNNLILDIVPDMENETVSATANMTLAEFIEAINNRELTGVTPYVNMYGMTMIDICAFGDYASQVGIECVVFMLMSMDMQLFWTADGFSLTPPEGM